MKPDSGELALTMAASQVEKTPTRGDQENVQLLKLAKAGDARAFEQIILLHQRLVLMTAWRVLGELDDAKDAALARVEERHIVKQGLKALSPKEREVLVLRDIQGLSTKEVANLLGSTQATVRSQLSTARIKLKEFSERFLRG